MADPMYFQPPVDAYVFPTEKVNKLREGSFVYSTDRFPAQAVLQPVTMGSPTDPSFAGAGDRRPPFEYPYALLRNDFPRKYYDMSSEMGVPVLRSGEDARQARYAYPTNENTRYFGDSQRVNEGQMYDINYQYAMDRLDKARKDAGLGPAPRNMYQSDFINLRRSGLPLEVTKPPEAAAIAGRTRAPGAPQDSSSLAVGDMPSPPSGVGMQTKMPASAGREIRKVLEAREASMMPMIPPPEETSMMPIPLRLTTKTMSPEAYQQAIDAGRAAEQIRMYQELGEQLPAVGPLFAFDPYEGR